MDFLIKEYGYNREYFRRFPDFVVSDHFNRGFVQGIQDEAEIIWGEVSTRL